MTKVNTKSVLRLVRDAIETYSPDYMHGLPKRDYLKQIDAALAQDVEWVGLTNEEMEKMSVENGKATFLNDDEATDILWFDGDCFALLKAAEDKLKEKNHDNTR
jgi:hypothetical protein